MICFACSGFPQYFARCIGALVKASDEKIVVVATRPGVPVEGMERLCGCPVSWIKAHDGNSLVDILGEVPRVLFVDGWAIPAFNRFSAETKRSGGKVVAMIDNNFQFSFKEILKAIRFRLCLRHRYDGYLVPGRSGERLLRFYGVKPKLIARGMYSADEKLFQNGRPLFEREKKIIFVGQFIERKNVIRLVKAFKRANSEFGNAWALELYGCGPLKEELKSLADNRIKVSDFVQPEQLAGLYQSARWFCLPSIEEHWGLVVHEAALSGCALLLSDTIGAAADLLQENNGITFDPLDVGKMANAFVMAMKMDNSALAKAQAVSVRLAGEIGLFSFVQGVNRLSCIIDG